MLGLMRVLVTGAARSIGRATAEILSERGHQVVATARDIDLLADLKVDPILTLDVSDQASVAAAVDAAGELDAVVNNAGRTGSGPLEDYPLDDFARVLEVNTLGPLRVAQAVLAQWRRRGSGVLVNISSVQGRVGTPLEGAYGASKHALEAISESLHYELGHFGIRVVIVEPGYIAPGMQHTADHAGPAAYGELHEQWRTCRPCRGRRLGGSNHPAACRGGARCSNGSRPAPLPERRGVRRSHAPGPRSHLVNDQRGAEP